MTRGAKEEYTCKRCKQPFMARVADRNRGWARFCSKSCKAVIQEKRTGQMKSYLIRRERAMSVEVHDIEDTFHPHSSYSLGQE